MVRLLPFAVAALLFFIAFSVTIGAHWFTAAEPATRDAANLSVRSLDAADSPGRAIPALALLDGLIVLSVALMGFGQVSPGTAARVGGPTVLVAGIVVIVLGVVLGLAAFGQLTFMLGLLMTPLFGQATYLALFGDFPSGTARATLALLLALRVGGGVALVFWSRSTLGAKGFVLLVLSVLVAGMVTSLLLGMVPAVLASVSDALAAIVVCVIAVSWGVVEVVSGASSILKVLAGGGRTAP